MSKVDVHHHVVSPVYGAAVRAAGGDVSAWVVPGETSEEDMAYFAAEVKKARENTAGGWAAEEWTVQEDRKLCQQIGVNTAILSHTAPGPDIEPDPAKAAVLARDMNRFCAKLRDDDPQHYGFFASVPSLLDPERCIAEIRFALNELRADGIILMTRYGEDNHYLGHADFVPVWDELNSHNAVIFIHPTPAVGRGLVSRKLPPPMFDYPHETARTAIDLVTSGMLSEHARDCKIILSHGGGTLATLVGRVEGLSPNTPFSIKTAVQIRDEASSFYFDTALYSAPEQLAALKRFAKPGHILFGSDWPNAPTPAVLHFTKQLEQSKEVVGEDFASIERGVAEVLFPRLAGASRT